MPRRVVVGLKVCSDCGRFDTPAVAMVSHDQFIGELNPGAPASTSS